MLGIIILDQHDYQPQSLRLKTSGRPGKNSANQTTSSSIAKYLVDLPKDIVMPKAIKKI